MVPERLVREARRAGPSSRFYTTGVMPHPADVWPQPAASPDLTSERPDGSSPIGDIHKFEGRFFIDGSCSTHVTPEMRRAGWAIVIKDAEDNAVARISSPLWRDLPQTPQAAEYVAYAAAVQFVAGPSRFYGDCANVIRQAGAAPSKVCAPTARYSSVLRDAQRLPERLRNIAEFKKVKAHVDPNSVHDPEERREVMGNAEADLLAKAAARRHPAQTPAEEAMLETRIKDAEWIMRLASTVLLRWLPQNKQPAAKKAGGKVGAPKCNGRPHDWEFAESAWRCRECLYCAIGATSNPKGTRGFCRGGGADNKSALATEGGHTLGFAKGEGMPIMFCLRCASWTARRSRGLARTCAVAPTAAGKQALGYIARGLHPWRPPGAGESQRQRLTFGDKTLWHGQPRAADESTVANSAADEAMLNVSSGADVDPPEEPPGPATTRAAEFPAGRAAGSGGLTPMNNDLHIAPPPPPPPTPRK